jgi:hypothetical protein
MYQPFGLMRDAHDIFLPLVRLNQNFGGHPDYSAEVSSFSEQKVFAKPYTVRLQVCLGTSRLRRRPWLYPTCIHQQQTYLPILVVVQRLNAVLARERISYRR